MQEPKKQRIFRMQPILCPWITSQPYHSSLWHRNRASSQDSSLANRFLNNPWVNKQMSLGIPTSQGKPLPSIQQSSSQFFHFLRLMQLFPNTHPATLHTVLVLCKNDFFCAVDKLLYAKRCKLLCYKKNLLQKNGRNKNLNLKVEAQKVSKFNKGQASSSGTVVDKKAEEVVLNEMLDQDVSNCLVINSFIEKPEDLSTLKKFTTDSSSESVE